MIKTTKDVLQKDKNSTPSTKSDESYIEFLDIRFETLLDDSSVVSLHLGSAGYDAGLRVRLDESTADGDATPIPVCREFAWSLSGEAITSACFSIMSGCI